MRSCSEPGCVALAAARSPLCTVHGDYARRRVADVPIHCYACGELIRIGALWVVREEGAFHNRRACLSTLPAHYAIPLLDAPPQEKTA